jgi:hypothetical protein
VIFTSLCFAQRLLSSEGLGSVVDSPLAFVGYASTRKRLTGRVLNMKEQEAVQLIVATVFALDRQRVADIWFLVLSKLQIGNFDVSFNHFLGASR